MQERLSLLHPNDGMLSGRTGFERKLIFVGLALTVACVGFIIGVAVLNNQLDDANQRADDADEKLRKYMASTTTSGPSPATNLCSTKECVKAASMIITSMNSSAKPCDDFYEFACGMWANKNPRPASESRWGSFNVLRDELTRDIVDIVNTPETTEDPVSLNQAKIMYKTCMDTEHVDSVGLEPIIQNLDELTGGWPMAFSGSWNESSFDWVTSITNFDRITNPPFYNLDVAVDQKNTSRSLVYIDQGTVGLNRAIYLNPTNEGYQLILDAYKTFLTESAAEVMKASLNVTELNDTDTHNIATAAEQVIAFETQLAKITIPEEMRRDSNRMYNSMTLAQLQNWTDSEIKDYMDWTKVFQVYFQGTNITIASEEEVIVQETDYLKNLVQLLNETDITTKANYIGFRLTMVLAPHTNQKMIDLMFDLQKAISGVTVKSPRWKFCGKLVTDALGFAVSSKYVTEYFSMEAKNQSSEMVEDIRWSFEELLKTNTWMDNDTIPLAKEKAEFVKKFIGYPDWILDKAKLDSFYSFPELNITADDHVGNVLRASLWATLKTDYKLLKITDRNEWLSYPAIVNAFYEPVMNSITFPAGILQAPFYGNGLQALNYGAIGVVIGHELTHGFDDEGRQYDKYGNLVAWWSNATVQAYLEKAQCFIDQYSHFKVPEAGDNVTVNGVTTQGENIADNGGIREAFLAYSQHYLPEHHETPTKLPGLEEYTDEQLFFLAHANVWCSSATPGYLLQQVLSDPHSPSKFRVIGPLQNSADFARAYNCPEGSYMNPKDKCVLW